MIWAVRECEDARLAGQRADGRRTEHYVYWRRLFFQTSVIPSCARLLGYTEGFSPQYISWAGHLWPRQRTPSWYYSRRKAPASKNWGCPKINRAKWCILRSESRRRLPTFPNYRTHPATQAVTRRAGERAEPNRHQNGKDDHHAPIVAHRAPRLTMGETGDGSCHATARTTHAK